MSVTNEPCRVPLGGPSALHSALHEAGELDQHIADRHPEYAPDADESGSPDSTEGQPWPSELAEWQGRRAIYLLARRAYPTAHIIRVSRDGRIDCDGQQCEIQVLHMGELERLRARVESAERLRDQLSASLNEFGDSVQRQAALIAEYERMVATYEAITGLGNQGPDARQ